MAGEGGGTLPAGCAAPRHAGVGAARLGPRSLLLTALGRAPSSRMRQRTRSPNSPRRWMGRAGAWPRSNGAVSRAVDVSGGTVSRAVSGMAARSGAGYPAAWLACSSACSVVRSSRSRGCCSRCRSLRPRLSPCGPWRCARQPFRACPRRLLFREAWPGARAARRTALVRCRAPSSAATLPVPGAGCSTRSSPSPLPSPPLRRRRRPAALGGAMNGDFI